MSTGDNEEILSAVADNIYDSPDISALYAFLLISTYKTLLFTLFTYLTVKIFSNLQLRDTLSC